MICLKFTFDKDEEELWLNDWCRQGWAMTGFFAGIVTFMPCQPEEFIYRIDLVPGKFLRADDYEGYAVFMREMGVQVIQRWGRWVYLRKKAEEGPFEVYSDTESKLALYRRIRAMFVWLLVIETLCSVSAWTSLSRNPEEIFVRGLVGLYLVLIAVVLRAIWRCSRKISALERGG